MSWEDGGTGLSCVATDDKAHREQLIGTDRTRGEDLPEAGSVVPVDRQMQCSETVLRLAARWRSENVRESCVGVVPPRGTGAESGQACKCNRTSVERRRAAMSTQDQVEARWSTSRTRAESPALTASKRDRESFARLRFSRRSRGDCRESDGLSDRCNHAGILLPWFNGDRAGYGCNGRALRKRIRTRQLTSLTIVCGRMRGNFPSVPADKRRRVLPLKDGTYNKAPAPKLLSPPSRTNANVGSHGTSDACRSQKPSTKVLMKSAHQKSLGALPSCISLHLVW